MRFKNIEKKSNQQATRTPRRRAMFRGVLIAIALLVLLKAVLYGMAVHGWYCSLFNVGGQSHTIHIQNVLSCLTAACLAGLLLLSEIRISGKVWSLILLAVITCAQVLYMAFCAGDNVKYFHYYSPEKKEVLAEEFHFRTTSARFYIRHGFLLKDTGVMLSTKDGPTLCGDNAFQVEWEPGYMVVNYLYRSDQEKSQHIPLD